MMSPAELETLADLLAARIQPPREVMDTVQAAAYLGVSTQFLEIARCKGNSPVYSKWGRLVKYRRVALDEWLASHEKRNTSEAA
ncbi:MAG: helix-turn-helix domain-containing protein [Sulfuricella sp.]|nr:helix-turn-helix domain-containing protein [Sulfuricella sp.]